MVVCRYYMAMDSEVSRMSDPLRLLTKNINPEVRKIVQALYVMTRRNPLTQGQWCGRGWDRPASSKEHNTGRAVDWMICDLGKRPTPRQYEGAMMVVNFFIKNAERLHLQWLLFSKDGVVTWSYNATRKGWRRLDGRGGISANHIDHIHFLFKPGVKYPVLNWNLPNSILENTEGEKIVANLDEKDAELIAGAILNFPVTANGKREPLVTHLAELFVLNAAQSTAVNVEANRDRAMQSELVAVLDKINKKLG